jgi:AcrR family transcriptional regulator
MAKELTARERNRKAKALEYMDASLSLMRSGDFTMNALAREMGGAVGTVYSYYRNKAELEAAVLEVFGEVNHGKGIDVVAEALPLFQQGNPSLKKAIRAIARDKKERIRIERLVLYRR